MVYIWMQCEHFRNDEFYRDSFPLLLFGMFSLNWQGQEGWRSCLDPSSLCFFLLEVCFGTRTFRLHFLKALPETVYGCQVYHLICSAVEFVVRWNGFVFVSMFVFFNKTSPFVHRKLTALRSFEARQLQGQLRPCMAVCLCTLKAVESIGDSKRKWFHFDLCRWMMINGRF